MKSALSISAAVLLAMSLTACGDNNDDQSTNTQDNAQSNAQNSENMGETNTASSDGGDVTSDDGDSTASTGDNGDTSTMQSSGQAASEDMPRAAVAVLHGTEGHEISATIRFTPQGGGLAYTTEAQGLTPGKHGYHIHLYGDCSAADGKSAGTHFNLKGSSQNPPQDIDRITGDLGDLDAGQDGTAHDEGMLDGASLTGAKSIVGRGVIIHEKPNDPSQPPIGAAGSRQACGVIGIAEPQDTAANDSGASDTSDSQPQSGDAAESM